MARYLAYFYLVPMGILSLIAIIAAIQLPAKDVSFWWPLALLTVAFPIYVAAKRAAMLSLKSERAQQINAEFAALYAAPIKSYDSGFWQLVKRWFDAAPRP